MIVTCTKPDAAARQLDAAIDLLFRDGDPLAIRTLAAAAHGVLADLAEHKKGGDSWRARIIEGSGVTAKAAKDIMNSAQNFLKHADRDPQASLSFPEEENDHAMFVATLECGSLGHPLTLRMQVFQIWYLATYPTSIGHDTGPVTISKKVFPFLEKLPRRQQLACGSAFLQERVDEMHKV